MAMMNPLQRRRLEEIIRQNPGALAQLVGGRGADLGGLAGMGGAPVSLAQIAGLAPQPEETVVSPAQPAPVAEGAPVAAPALPPARPMGPGYRADGAAQQAMNTPEAILGAARMQAAQMSDEAARAAVVPAEVEAILGKREKRYAEQLAEVEEDKKKAGWEALAMAGFRMAQSQSPYFMSALATGMEAGLNGFNASKAARAEKKARLQTAEEDVVLAREAAKQKARADAEARQAREIGLAGTLLGQQEAGGKIAEFQELAPFRREVAKLQPDVLRSEIGQRQASAESERAQGRYYDRSPGAGMGGGGGGGGGGGTAGFKPSDIRSMLNNASTRKAALQKQLAQTILSEDKIPLMAAIAAADDEINQLRQMAGLPAVRGAMAPAPAAARPTAAPRPGDIVDGYRFKGGNPADRKNWEKVR